MGGLGLKNASKLSGRRGLKRARSLEDFVHKGKNHERDEDKNHEGVDVVRGAPQKSPNVLGHRILESQHEKDSKSADPKGRKHLVEVLKTLQMLRPESFEEVLECQSQF